MAGDGSTVKRPDLQAALAELRRVVESGPVSHLNACVRCGLCGEELPCLPDGSRSAEPAGRQG